MRLPAALCVFFLSAVPALAVPATPEGAARVEAAIRKVLGSQPGVVSVTPEGATYRAAVDIAPLAALVPAPGLEVSVTPYVLTLTDNGDGTWGIAEDQDFAFSFTLPGAFEMTYRIASIRSEGVFDESLVAMTSYRAETGPWSMASKEMSWDGSTRGEDVSAADGMTVEIAARAGASGGVDIDQTTRMRNYRQSVTPLFPGSATEPVEITIADHETVVRFEGLRSADILNLVGYFVARPDQDRIVADQEMLRAALGAVLPLFGRVEGELAAHEVKAKTPLGAMAADRLGLAVGMNGAVPEGRFGHSLSVEGLMLPPGLVPDWARKLLPEDATLGFEITGYDLAAPAALLVGSFDLSSPEFLPPEAQFGLLGAFLPRGTVDIAITPSSAGSDLYGIEASGVFSAGMMVPPSGKIQVSATGIDAVQAALDDAADDPDAAGLRGAAGIARALARPQPDGSMAWEIEFTESRRVLVNGTDVTGQ